MDWGCDSARFRVLIVRVFLLYSMSLLEAWWSLLFQNDRSEVGCGYFEKAGSLSLAFLLATPHRRSGFSTWLLKTEWEDQFLPIRSSRLRFFFSPKTVQPKIGGSFLVPAAWSRLSLDSVFNLGRIWLGIIAREGFNLARCLPKYGGSHDTNYETGCYLIVQLWKAIHMHVIVMIILYH